MFDTNGIDTDYERDDEENEWFGEDAARVTKPEIQAELDAIAEQIALADQLMDEIIAEEKASGDNTALEGYDYWADEHEYYPLADWGYLVENGDTRMGYWEWVRSKLAEEDEEPANESMDGDHQSALASIGWGDDEDYPASDTNWAD
jgi:hypothetical protein